MSLPDPTNERFLIVRLSAIGDTVHTLPLAAALRKNHPGCHLGWVVESPSAPLVVDNPLLDWWHVLPKGWLKSLARVRELTHALRVQKFSVAFDVQGLTKSATAAWLSGAPCRVGFERGESREIAPLLDTRLVHPRGIHVIDKVLSLLDGIDEKTPGPAEFVFPPCSEIDRQAIDALADDDRFAAGFCLMGPWGSFAAKRWPLERFAEVAARLRREAGIGSLILGHGDRERSAVAAALATIDSDAAALAPDVSLTGVVELARRARLFVGCDSFPLHAAAGAGCPSIGLFGVTDPHRLGPYGEANRSVYEMLTLVKSTSERRRLGPDNMLALGTAKVAAACLELLARKVAL